jgi:hypothetical protein
MNKYPHLSSSDADLFTWIEKIRAWSYSKGGKPGKYTHLCLDGYHGGKIFIKDSDSMTFLGKLAASLRLNRHLYIAEMRTEIFRFFVDFDPEIVHPRTKFTSEERDAFCKILLEVVTMFYPSEDTENPIFNMVICDLERSLAETSTTAIQKAQEKDDLEALIDLDESESYTAQVDEKEVAPPQEDDHKHKTRVHKDGNLHIHFPNLYVSAKQAAAMATAMAIVLEMQLGKLTYIYNEWTKVIDPSVYMSNGLRMMGCRKCMPCPSCKGGRCTDCHMIGKVDQGRVYRVSEAYRCGVKSPELLTDITRNLAREIAFCSIRNTTRKATIGWKKPDLLPGADMNTLQVYEAKMQAILDNPKISAPKKFDKLLQTKRPNAGFAEDAIGERGKLRNADNMYGPGSVAFGICKDIVQGFHTNYNHVQIKSVQCSNGYKCFFVRVSGHGSTFCLNLQPPKVEHKSNTVYFIVAASGVYQRCWCTCSTTAGRKHGECSGFKSIKRPLLTNQLQALFPEACHKQERGAFGPVQITTKFNTDGGLATNASLNMIKSQLYNAVFVRGSYEKGQKNQRKRKAPA